MELNEGLKLLLAFVIGAVIGLERERSQEILEDVNKQSYAPLGLRSFSLISTLGAIIGLMVSQFLPIALLISTVLFVILIAYYIFHTIKTQDIGITTEISLIYAYVIGLLIALEVVPIQITLAIAVVLLLVLSRKIEIKKAVGYIKDSELNAFTSFALIALVVLPFLPNTSFTLGQIPNIQNILSSFNINLGNFANIELINPFKLWFIVALITGVDLVGHIMERTVGQKKGWILTSIAGGIVSSTATTQTLAQQSKGLTKVNPLVSAALFSNLASFFQIGFLIAVLSTTFFAQSLVVLVFMIISTAIMAFYFYKSKEDGDEDITETKKRLKGEQIINLVPALKFALLFTVIRLMSQIFLIVFGGSGFIIASGLGALTGLDAVIINTTELAGSVINYQTAVLTLILANAVNLISKSVYAFIQGSREFATKFSISVAIIIVSSLVSLVFVF